MKQLYLLFLACLLGFANVYAQEALPVLVPRTIMFSVVSDTATALENFSGNQALYTASRGPLFGFFLNTWMYSNPFTGDTAILNDVSDTQAMDALLARNGFGAGFTTGFGWSGKGIGLGIELTTDVYESGTCWEDAQGLFQGRLSGILGYGLILISTNNVLLTLGADVRPFIRFIGSLDGDDLTAFLAMLRGRDTQTFISVPVYAGASAELNAGALLVVGNAVSLGFTAHNFATQQAFQETTIQDLLASFSANSMGGVKAYYSIPNFTAGAKVHIPALIGIAGSMDCILTAQFNDILRAVQPDVLFWDYAACSITVSLFNNTVQGSIGYKNSSCSYGLRIRAWIITLEAAYFVELIEKKQVQGFSLGASIKL